MSELLQSAYTALRSAWPYSDRLLWVAGSWAAVEGTFWISNAILHYGVYNNAYFDRWKIQPHKWPSKELVAKTMKKAIFTAVVVRPISAWFLYLLFKRFGMNMNAPVPSLWTIVKQFALFIFINDTGFYWAHRLLHHPSIYGYIHKQHHEYKQTIGIASTYAHPIEDFLANAIPSGLGALLIGAHPVVWWLWIWVRMVETVDAHSGYNFPFSPFQLISSLQGGADRHDYHHSHNIGNFGSFFVFWDWLCGTDKAYLAWRAKKDNSE